MFLDICLLGIGFSASYSWASVFGHRFWGNSLCAQIFGHRTLVSCFGRRILAGIGFWTSFLASDFLEILFGIYLGTSVLVIGFCLDLFFSPFSFHISFFGSSF